mmetsp:Transcript_137328/g.342427  ORF Transcript_137328/g.342427 Transcript_137328/m.342427 type:complete len:183 (-) Transcript_137328:29-577(-)
MASTAIEQAPPDLVSQQDCVAMWVPRLKEENAVYKKTAKMHAKRLSEACTVVTMIDGKVETQKEAQAGEWLMHGTEGERYAIPPACFESRYAHDRPEPAADQALADEGFQLYQATGRCLAHQVTDEEVARDFPAGKFMAAWGEPMSLEPGDYIASPLPAANEIARIAASAFAHTYERLGTEG